LVRESRYFSDLHTQYSIEEAAMTARRELEIKLELPPTSVGRLKKIPLIHALKALSKRTTEVSVYFDTDKHKPHKNGLMLRVRRIGKRYVQTIKGNKCRTV
jgi:inorganic triphosphatase YgiF